MQFYRAGPPLIRGVQVPTSTDDTALDDWRELWLFLGAGKRHRTDDGAVMVPEAHLRARPGDWIVRDEAGQLRAWAPALFDPFYEPQPEEITC